MEGYTKYANKEALELARWAHEENNRIKASKLKRIADKMEDKYRNTKEFQRDIDAPYKCVFKPIVPLSPPGQPNDPQPQSERNPFEIGTTRGED